MRTGHLVVLSAVLVTVYIVYRSQWGRRGRTADPGPISEEREEEAGDGLSCRYLLMFNRVPKTGSEMLVLLLQWLEGHNNYKHIRLKNTVSRRLSPMDEDVLIKEVQGYQQLYPGMALSFDRHFYFVNFQKYGAEMPCYINMIRDPVEKVISRFYYHHIGKSPESIRYKTIEDCLILSGSECTFRSGETYDLTIPYFCGQHYECSILNSRWALETAKLNVEKYFTVVGVLEDLDITLQVLEHYVPAYFKGVQHMYFKELLEPFHNKNRKKPAVDKFRRQQLYDNLTLEYEFYDFIRHRLKNQMENINSLPIELE